MNLIETQRLLVRIAAKGQFISADAITAEEWMFVLKDFDERTCIDEMRAWFADNPGGRITAEAIRARILRSRRLRPEDVAADVRSARARGIVPADWPTNRPLDERASRRLQAAREATKDPETVSEVTGGKIAPEIAAQLPPLRAVPAPGYISPGAVVVDEEYVRRKREAMEELDRLREAQVAPGQQEE